MRVKILGNTAQEIFESVRQLSNDGVLKPGDALPPVRELAADLGVNRNTVSSAYQRLTKAGIAITQGRLGTRICALATPGEQEGKTDTALCDLADGSPRRAWLPDLNEVAKHTQLTQYLYGEAPILPTLIEFARAWFAPTCPSEFQLTLCNGAIDSLERLMAAHLVPGDKVVVEDPCFISSANAIRLAGMQIVGAQVDQCGMRPDALQEALKKGARAILMTPRAHNPTGANITSERAKQLRSILVDYPNVMVLEDDHFALMADTEHFSVIPDSTRHWAIFRSVSKGLGPDLRMAFVAADADSVKRINARLAPGMSWVSRILQSLVLTCLTQDTFKHQLALAKQDCMQRRNHILKALVAQNIAVNEHTEGLNIWVPVGAESQAVAWSLSKKGWLVRPGSTFDIDSESQAIRVSIQNLDQGNIQQFVHDIATVVQV